MFYSISKNEKAIKIDFTPLWDAGSPNPHLLQSEEATFLLYKIKNEPDKIAIVEWEGCQGALLGGLNDEAFSGHKLWNKGLKDCLYAAQIENSSWIEALRKGNSVHPYHRDEMFSSLKHYILLFKDSTFECVSAAYSIEILKKSMPEALEDSIKKLGQSITKS